MHKITVLPQNEIIIAKDGENLKTVLTTNGFDIKSPCGGCASCGQCVVIIKDGLSGLSDVSFEEKQLLGNVFHITSERLSCQTFVKGDFTVDVSGHKGKEKIIAKTKRRTREQANTIIEERRENSKNRPERQGGFNKPKSFSIDSEE